LDNNGTLASAELYVPVAQGDACAADTDCFGLSCVDGVCCNTPCDSPCHACSVAAGALNDGTCSPITGGSCDDNDACTTADTCLDGVCKGSPAVVCQPIDQCHNAGVCDPQTGQCSNPVKPSGASCDDGNLCTQSDTCQTGQCVGAQPVVCQAQDQCHDPGVCDSQTGECTKPLKPNGVPCNDGNLCTQNASCQAGSCTSGPSISCTPIDDCHGAGSCNPQTGQCSTPAYPNGTPCNDNDACTQSDTCQAGACLGSNPVSCAPPNACQKSVSCNPQNGQCVYVSKDDGVPCDDGNPCTQNDACTQGACAGMPKSCPAPDQCHVAGICDPMTGQCTGTLPDGYACDDGNPCTENDACTQGVCGGKPKSCPAPDQCHITGVCDPMTGQCTGTLPDGYACDDGNPCTENDACAQGSCTGGSTKACPAPDACHTNGTCDSMTGDCVYPEQPNGLVCDDGDACTELDTCQNGICTAGTPVLCPPAGICQTGEGTCDASTRQCTYTAAADGSSCDDGNACTQMDSCQSGTCVGENPVECLPPPDTCHDPGVCNPVTGICDYPLNGTVCPENQQVSSGGGCSCRSAGSPVSGSGASGGLLGLLLFGTRAFGRRRRAA